MDDELDPRNAKRPQGEKSRILSREVFYKGTTIIRQGDSAFRAYYIEDGRVEVRVEEDGISLKISELGPGDIFGEMALISRGRRARRP
ncbi:MAG: cyclic nucleotide-binding domain-containing protein [Alphaproteobacteria bacterium]